MSRDPRHPGTYRRPPVPPPPDNRRTPRKRTALWDVITTVFLIASVGVIGLTILLLSNPESSINPWPKPTLPELLQLPSATPVTPSATPTITPTRPTNTPFPTFTASPPASDTPLPSITPTPVVPGAESVTRTPIPTLNITLPPEGPQDVTVQPGVVINTPRPDASASDYPFVAAETRYVANDNEFGCQWLGIAGNVIGINGEPLTDLVVEAIGSNFETVTFTGGAQRWGLAGYEIEVDDRPNTESYDVRLLGPTGLPLSEFISVTTGDNCDQNVVVVDFLQVKPY